MREGEREREREREEEVKGVAVGVEIKEGYEYLYFFLFFLSYIYIRSGPVFRLKKSIGPKTGPDQFGPKKLRPDRTIISIKTEKNPIIRFGPVGPFGLVRSLHTPTHKSFQEWDRDYKIKTYNTDGL